MLAAPDVGKSRLAKHGVVMMSPGGPGLESLDWVEDTGGWAVVGERRALDGWLLPTIFPPRFRAVKLSIRCFA